MSVVLFLLLGGGVSGLLLFFRRLQAQRQSAEAERQARLRNPDWAAIEKEYAIAVPPVLAALYGDFEVVRRRDFRVETRHGSWAIAQFHPLGQSEEESSAERFPLAANDAGDQYLVNLRESDPPLWFRDHEDDEDQLVADRLSEFLTALRQAAERR